MKKHLLLLALCFLSLHVFGAIRYDVNSVNSMTATASACLGAASPIVTFVYNTCTAGTTGASSGVVDTVTWFSNTSATTTGATIVSGPTPFTVTVGGTGNLTYSPPTASAGTLYYYCKVRGTGCGPTNVLSGFCTVTINPLPSAIGGPTSVCVGSNISLTDATSGGTWATSASGTASISSTSGSPITVTGVAAGTATISYTSAAGCKVTKAISVNALPASISGSSTVCNGASTAYSDATSGGTWSTSNAAVASVSSASGSSISVIGTSVGGAIITYTSSLGCVTTNAITVNGPGAITGTTSVCGAGATATVSDITAGGAWSSVNTSVATIDATGNISAVGTGTSVISYTVSGCASTVTFTVSAGPATISPSGSVSVCTGGTLSMTDATPSGSWSSSSTALATIDASTGVLTGIANGTVTISYTTAGCAPATQVVNVTGPAAIAGASSVCAGVTTTLSDATASGSWSSVTPSVATINASGVVTGVTAGTSIISYTVSGCAVTTTITVTPAPPAISPATASVCVGSNVTLSNSVSGGTWSSSAPATATVDATTGIVTGVAAGTATISYSTAACTPVTRSVTVQAALPAITGTTNACIGSSTTLANTTTGGTWSSSSTAIASVNATTGAVRGVSSGTATITYTYLACATTTSFTTNVTPSVITGGSSFCAPIPVTIFTQGWESGVPQVPGTPVAGWTYIRGTGAEDYDWSQVTSGSNPPATAHGGSYFAFFNSYSITSGYNATLCSPSFSLSGIGGTTVKFWVYRDATGYYTGAAYSAEAITCFINTSASTTGATSLGVVPRDAARAISGTAISGTSTTTTSNWYQYTVTIPATFTGSTNYILFRAASRLGNDQYLDDIVCAGNTLSSVALSDSVSGGTWSSSASTIATVASTTGVVTGAGVGAATITYTIGSCTATKAVSSLGVPAAITGPTLVTTGTTITLLNSISGGTWSSSAPSVASVNRSTGVVTGVSVGTATITYSTGCGAAVTYNINSANACSGTPTGGTASTSTAGGDGATSFTLTNTGYTIAGGITFQWQISNDSTTWFNIAGATNPTYTFTGISSSYYYRCNVICAATSSTASSYIVKLYYINPSSCTPTFYDAYGCTNDYVVCSSTNSFRVAGAGSTLNDATDCIGSGYIDATSTSATCTLNAGSTYSTTIGSNIFGYSLGYQIWIDFDNDGTFSTTESVGGGSFSTTSTVGTITLPSGTLISTGVYRMRVEVVYGGGYPSIDPCPTSAAYTSGDVRDYRVTVNVPPAFTLAPTNIPFPPTTPGSSSAAVTASFSGSFLSPSSGSFTVTAPTGFQVSSTGSSWSNSYTVSYSAGALGATTVYTRFSPSSTISYSGNVAITGGGISGANIAVTGTGAAACSGTPTAGTATASPLSGDTATVFTLTASGYSVAGGISFQWQSSPDSTTWTNISGATLATTTYSGIRAHTYIRCVVTCAGSGSSAITYAVRLNYFPASSCTPAWIYGLGYGYACTTRTVAATTGYPFTLVGASGTISDAAACNEAGYLDQTTTGITCTLNVGTTYTCTLGANTAARNMSAQVWIDFNNNGAFESTESVGGGFFTATTFSPSLIIPSGTSPGIAAGIYRMRVEAEYNYHTYPSLNPCPTASGSYYYGEVRDYKITIATPPTLTVTPNLIAFAPTAPGSSSATATSVLTGNFLLPTSGTLTVTAPAGFLVSATGSSWGSSYTISYTAGTVAATTIYAQFNPSAAITYSGNITVSGGSASTANIAVTGTGAATCSGTPTAGTASVSPTTGGSSTTFTLICSGYTVAGGISFQWQSSSDSATWSNISGATLSVYSFSGLTARRYYRCIVSCPASGLSATTAGVAAYFFSPSSCTPTWLYPTGCSYRMVVCTTGYPFTLNGASGSISDVTACNTAGYIDETTTGITCTLNAGTTYTVTLGANTTGYSMNDQIWIDFNGNGTFETSESVGGAASWTTTTISHNITLPAGYAGVSPGVYRMRVETEFNYHTYPSLNPCPVSSAGYYYGDVRDYKITIAVPPTYTLAPTSMTFSPVTPGSVSSALSATLNGYFLTPGSGSLTVTAPTGFQVSATGASFGPSYTITYTGGNTGVTPIYVQFAPSATTSYSGNVAIAGGGISGANISVTGTGAAACSGTPTAGTAAVSPTFGSAATVFTLTCSGYSVAGGISFQWQSSPDNATWTNITGATTAIYSFTGITASRYYRCNVTCSASGITATTAIVAATYFAASSCTPSFASAASACSSGEVVCTTGYPFKLNGSSGSINDATACNATGYNDETGTSNTCTLNAGTSYTVTLGANPTGGYSMSDQIWIDFNDNGTFESTESLGGTYWSTGTASHTITIPAGSARIAPGLYRMRVEAEYYDHSYPYLNPCPSAAGGYNTGDVRDYRVTINVPPIYTVTPTSIAFTPTVPGASSATSTATLSAVYLTPASAALTVTAPSGFLVSSTGSSWATSYTILYTGTTLSATTIYIQFNPASATTYSGNVTITGGGITGANIAVTGTGAVICSGTPTAGAAGVSPSTGSTTTPLSLSLTGYTVSGALTFQWQSSADTISWTNITGATTASYVYTGLTANTYFRCNVTCPSSGVTSASTNVMATWNIPASSCTPTFGSASLACSTYNMYVRMAVTGAVGAINDVTACSGTGYEDLSSTYSCTLLRGTTYTATINTGTTYATSENCQVWIDYNNNGTFESSESVGGISPFSSANQLISLSIPTTAATGLHRMRLVGNYSCCGYSAYPSMNPCPTTSIAYGDVRDYKVNVVAPVPCSGTPSAGTTGSSVTSGCSPVSPVLYASGAVGTSGLTYQWKSSPTGASYTNIAGATDSAYAPTISSNIYYQCQVTCSVSGLSATTSGTLITAVTPPAAITGSSIVCVSSTTTLANTVTGGTWSTSDAAVASVNPSTGVVSGVAVGSCTVSYTTSGCTPAVYTISAVAAPAAITGTASVCAGSSTTLADAVAGGTWSSSNSSIATVSSTGVVTGVTNGSARITYATGCGTAATRAYTVNTLPSAIVGLATICTASTQTFTDATSGGTWTTTPTTYGTIGASTGLFSSSTTTGTTLISYSIGTCRATFSLTVGSSSPAAITGAPIACTGATATLSDATTGGVWSSSNTAIATVVSTTGVVRGVAPGSANISYSTGCGSAQTISWTTLGTSVSLAYSSGSLTGPICTGGTMSLTSGTLSGGTYSWSGPNSFTSTLQSPSISSVTELATGVYTFSATVGGCPTGAKYLFAAVNPVPTVSVTATPASICVGSTSTLSAIPTSPVATNYAAYAIPYNPLTLTSPSAGPVGDEVSTNYSIPFGFKFYGTTYNSVNICTDGYISFSSTDANYTTEALPSATAPGAMVALFWHDIDNSTTGTISYQTLGTTPNRKFVVNYTAVPDFSTGSSTGTGTGQIVLYETSNIVDVFVTSYSSTAYTSACGVQNAGGSLGATVPGQNNTSYRVNGGTGWRFVMPNYSYTWAPATGLSSTTVASPVASGLTTSTIYTVTTIDAYNGCTTPNRSYDTVIVNPRVSIYSVTGGTGCTATGVAVGVSNSQTGATYRLYADTALVGTTTGITGSAITFGTQYTPGTYKVTATFGSGCIDTMSGSVTINRTPSITLGANPSVCQPLASTAITYSGATFAPTTYSISWGAAAISAGFSNVTSGTLAGGSITLAIPSTSVSGVFSGTITVSNGTCTSASYSFTLTVYANPTASIVTPSNPCRGYATTIAFTGTSGASVSYTVDGGSALTGTLTGGTYSFSSGPLTAAHVYALVSAYNPVCTTAVVASVTVTPTPMEWTGSTSIDWNNAGNWRCGFVPGAADSAGIPSGTTRSPDIAASASGTTGSLRIDAGATVNVNNGATLNVKGNITNNGNVTGAGILSMNNTSGQTVSGIGYVKNLDINNSAGVTVNTGARLTIKGTLSMTSGTLATGDSVVLYSDTFGTARVAAIATGAAITGNVKVNQFFAGGRRAYRFWAHPFNDFVPLSQVFQAIDISGSGGAANGFINTATNAPSSYRYNPYVGNSSLPGDPGWKPFTSTYGTPDSNKFKRYMGIRIYYRGAKGEGTSFGAYTPSSTVASQWGVLNQGSQNVPLMKGTSSGQDYNMVGNPYPSPVDIGTVIYNAAAAGRITGAYFYIWNPFLNTAGQFQAVAYSTGGATPAAVPYYLQTNNAFQVRAAHDGDQLNFTESNKSANISAAYSLMKVKKDLVALYLYDVNYHPYDMWHVRFNSDATDAEDNKYDGGKPSGAEVNFYSLSADGQKLCVDERPYKAESVIPLGISSNFAQDYILRAEQMAVPDGGTLYLHDKLLQQYVLLQQGTEYRFSITKDASTQGEGRFELSMKPSVATVSPAIKGLDVVITPNPTSDNVKISFTQGSANKVSIRLMDVSGVSVYNQDLGLKQNGAVTVPLSNLAAGIYMVELTSGDQKVLQRLIKE